MYCVLDHVGLREGGGLRSEFVGRISEYVGVSYIDLGLFCEGLFKSIFGVSCHVYCRSRVLCAESCGVKGGVMRG